MSADPTTVWTVVLGMDAVTVQHTAQQGWVYADMLTDWGDSVKNWRGTTVLHEGYYDNDWAECPDGCGLQRITLFGSNPGYTGMSIYWAYLKCGHQWVDASADSASAAE